jgi:ESS family glutamate:Na+ symporter
VADTFGGVLAFAFLVCMILVGTILRANVKLLQTALVPAALIGGIVGFTLLAMDWSFGFTSEDFTAFTFHFFTLSFMSLCLTGSEKKHEGGSVVIGAGWLSGIWTISLVTQALVGLLMITLYNGVSGEQLSIFLGAIATHGFTQGPGQAVAMGSIWQSEFGIDMAIDFGLIYASAGFVLSFLIGVPIARYFVKNQMNSDQEARIDTAFLSGIQSQESDISTGKQITHPGNVDSLVFHLSILGLAYLVTDQYLQFVQPHASGVELFGVNLGIIFSHNLFFFHGLLVCVIMRSIMDKFGWGRFIDDETQRHVTGSSVDLMVVATVMSIKFALLSTFIVPILMVCLAITIVTALLCFGLGRKQKEFGPERMIAVFGCCCGSTGSGLLLLRILDPGLRSPIARELAFFNVIILFATLHILAVMAPVLPGIDLQTIVIVYLATAGVGFACVQWLGKRLRSTPG